MVDHNESQLPDAQVTYVITSLSCVGQGRPDTWLALDSFPPHLVSTVRVYLHFQLDEIMYTLEALPLILLLWARTFGGQVCWQWGYYLKISRLRGSVSCQLIGRNIYWGLTDPQSVHRLSLEKYPYEDLISIRVFLEGSPYHFSWEFVRFLWPGNKLKPKPIHIVSYLYGSLSENHHDFQKRKNLLPLNIPVDSTERRIPTHRLSRCLRNTGWGAWSFTERALVSEGNGVMCPRTYGAHHSNKITSASGLHLQNTPRIPALLPHLPRCSYTHLAFLFLDTPRGYPTALRIHLSSWRWLHSRHGQPGSLHSLLSTWSIFNLLQPLNLELAPSSGLCICWNLLLLDLSRTTSFSSIRSLGNRVSWEMPPF